MLNAIIDKVFNNAEIKHSTVESVMEPAFPLVDFHISVEKIGGLINKDNGAVLAKDEKGDYHIVTKYDVIQSLAK